MYLNEIALGVDLSAVSGDKAQISKLNFKVSRVL